MTPLLARRLAYSLLLLAYVFYAARLAPPDNGHEPSFLALALGRGPARNPAIWAVFNLLGVVPLMCWGLLFPDGRGQRVWAWPFALGMMAFGAFALLPYLILRHPYTVPVVGKTERFRSVVRRAVVRSACGPCRLPPCFFLAS